MTPPSDPEWPASVRSLFWEYDPGTLEWETDRDLIVRRVLSEGNWEAISWLRDRMDETALRRWIVASPAMRCLLDNSGSGN
jgi:hypothetical protein